MNPRLRREVIERWEKAGKPLWDIEKTTSVCLKVNYDYEKQGLNPTPNFRNAIDNDDKNYISQWVFGCHFPWLNPR